MRTLSGPFRLARRILLASCVILWVGAFTVSHIPQSQLPSIPIADKRIHFAGFFALEVLLILTLAAQGLTHLRRAPIALGALIVYAFVDELTQPLVNRYADLLDVAADVAGAAAAAVLCEPLLWAARAAKRRSHAAETRRPPG